jgi:hypothetical protein
MDLLTTIKTQMRPVLNQVPQELTRQFMDDVIHLLDIDSIEQMKKGLRSLLTLYTFKNTEQTKMIIWDCIQLILESERNAQQ